MSFVEKQSETYTCVKRLKGESIPVSVNITSENSITKVISVLPVARVEQILVNSKNSQIEGKLCAKVIIQTSDGAIKCLENATNFKTMVLDENITPNSELFAMAKVVGVSGLNAGKQSVSFNVNVKIELNLVVKSSFDYLASVEKAESKTQELKFSDVVAATTQEFNLELELEQPSNVSEVLCVDSSVQINKVEASVDVVCLTGEIITNLIYLNNDETAKLKNQLFVQNFTHELMATNITPENKVNASVCVCDTKIQLDGELNSSKGTIILGISLKANIFVEKEKSVTLVVDAFCPRYNLVMENSNLNVCSPLKECSCVEKIDGSVMLGEESERIDRVLCVSGQNVVVENVEIENGNCIVTGKMLCNIVFTLDDENCSINSILTTIPFSFTLPHMIEGELCCLEIVVREIDARQKRSKEIDIMAEVNVNIKSRTVFSVTFLSDLSLGSERDAKLLPMSVYFVSNLDSLWDLSKTLCVSGGVIMEQNPNLTFPITEPIPVIVYRKREIS